MTGPLSKSAADTENNCFLHGRQRQSGLGLKKSGRSGALAKVFCKPRHRLDQSAG
jgi:hypothetical protein